MISFQVQYRDEVRNANTVIEIAIEPETMVLYFIDYSKKESGKFTLVLPPDKTLDTMTEMDYITIVHGERSLGNCKDMTMREADIMTQDIKNRLYSEVSQYRSEKNRKEDGHVE